MKPKYAVLLVAGLGGLLTVANLAPAQEWTLLTSAPNGRWRSVATSADGIKLVAAGVEWRGDIHHNPLPIYISSDSGMTWMPTGPTNHWSSVACSADGTKLVAVSDFEGIYTSADSGGTWTQTTAPFDYWTSVASSADGTTLVAVGDGEVYTSGRISIFEQRK